MVLPPSRARARRRSSPEAALADTSLLSHYRVVAQHLSDDRTLRQKGHLLCRAHLKLPAVLNDGRTCSDAGEVRSARRATAQPDRREKKADAPPLQASVVVRHGLSPWS